VGDDLESIRQRLEAAARPVAAVLARADELTQQRRLLVGAEGGDAPEDLGLTRRRRLEQKRGEQLLFAPVRAQESDGRCGGAALDAEAGRGSIGRLAPIPQELDPASAAIL